MSDLLGHVMLSGSRVCLSQRPVARLLGGSGRPRLTLIPALRRPCSLLVAVSPETWGSQTAMPTSHSLSAAHQASVLSTVIAAV